MVLPLYDDNPFRLPHRPIVTWSLIGLNFLIFAFEFASSSSLEDLVAHFGVVPAAFVGDGVVPGALPPVLTLVSYMFLHADIGHIFGNMIFLWVFGDNVEEALGRVRFLAFYLGCGVLGALAFIASDAHSDVPLIGASGAISGTVIAYVMLRPCAKITVLVSIIPLRLSAYWVVSAFAILQLISLGSASKSDVAYWCHFGGMVAGAVLLLVMRPAGVRLFDCIRPEQVPVEPAATMPDASGLPGAPRHHDPYRDRR
jgi:membrane associated rhomboid family serine protease